MRQNGNLPILGEVREKPCFLELYKTYCYVFPTFQEPPLTASPRPVSHADPAWFATLPRLRPDGSEDPDYGQVFFQPTADGGLAYSFDRAGLRFCRRLPPPAPRRGWLDCQGRAFRIAGPVQ